MKFIFVRALVFVVTLLPGLAAGAPGALPGPGRTFLLIDDEHVYYRPGTVRRVVEFAKYDGNPVIAPNKPWESEAIGWCSQLRHPVTGKFQMWYQGYTQRDGDRTRKSVVCYAESDDGRTWLKPNLGLFAFYEEKETNVVLIGAGGHGDRYGNSVLYDVAERDPARRYKMVYSDWAVGERAQEGASLYAAVSPDGIHWTKLPEPLLPFFTGAKGHPTPKIGDAIYVEQPTAKGVRRSWRWPLTLSDAADLIYDPTREVYVIYGKMWMPAPDGTLGWKHAMGRSESRDFRTWSHPVLLLTTDEHDAPQLEFHTSPVFQYRDLYLSLNQVMDRNAGVIDLELMHSRDGMKWDRSLRGQVIVPRGQGAVFDASALASNASPVVVGDEIRFYYGAYRYSMTGGIARWGSRQVIGSTDYLSGVGYAYTKRDRFASLRPDPRLPGKARRGSLPSPNVIGSVTFKPRELAGATGLTLNANAGPGQIVVEVLNEQGYLVPGFTHEEAIPLRGDGLDLAVRWKQKSIRDLPPGKYQVRVHLDQAELFALSLQ